MAIQPSYPTSLDTDALSAVATAARQVASGQLASVDKAKATHACWSLIGTGLNYGLPDANAPQAKGAVDLNALADACDALAAGRKAALPWADLLKMALTLLLTLLG